MHVNASSFDVSEASDLGVISWVCSLRDNFNFMNEVHIIEKIEDSMKESAPGENDVRRGYVKSANKEVKIRVIEMVQKMLESRANE